MAFWKKYVNFQLKYFPFTYALTQVVLSKFVRQMGDLLPSTLYISYLRMLKGLANGPQCSHYAFSLLKTNGATHSKSTFFLKTGNISENNCLGLNNNRHIFLYFSLKLKPFNIQSAVWPLRYLNLTLCTLAMTSDVGALDS